MSIRDSLTPDIGGIGKKIERPEPQKPAILQPVRPGVVRSPDGKLATDIPENELANGLPYVFLSQAVTAVMSDDQLQDFEIDLTAGGAWSVMGI